MKDKLIIDGARALISQNTSLVKGFMMIRKSFFEINKDLYIRKIEAFKKMALDGAWATQDEVHESYAVYCAKFEGGDKQANGAKPIEKSTPLGLKK